MKRTAFVGLSGPLGYVYRSAARRGGPNPVLEGAMGLFLYYDEIVFVARGPARRTCGSSTMCTS